MFKNLLSITILATVMSCAPSEETSQLKLRNLTSTEALDDFNEIVSKIKSHYGPLEFKEERFGFEIDTLANEYRVKLQSMTTDLDYFSVYAEFLTELQDAHVSIDFPSNSIGLQRYRCGLFLTPVEGKTIVGFVDPTIADRGIVIGDEILKVDGSTPQELLKKVLKYTSLSNPISNEHFITYILSPKAHMKELIPTNDRVNIELQRVDGSQYSVSLNWRIETDATVNLTRASDVGSDAMVEVSKVANLAPKGSFLHIGAVKPYFVNSKSIAKFGIMEVKPSSAAMEKHKLDPEKLPPIYSALYRYEGKTLLLVRISSYSAADGFTTNDYVKYYRAILEQYEPFVDGLMIDQNNNPGGSVLYVSNMASLFLNEEAPNFVQAQNTDRRWINGFREWALEVDSNLQSEEAVELVRISKIIEDAYDNGDNLSSPVVFGSNWMLQPDKTYTFKKPILVLTNELALSGGDGFPMIMKRSGRAKTFGERTAGAGGSVEEILELSNSGASVRLTRGLFTTWNSDGVYDNSQWIENNGVTPSIHYTPTFADFSAGFVEYFAEANKALLAEIAADAEETTNSEN